MHIKILRIVLYSIVAIYFFSCDKKNEMTNQGSQYRIISLSPHITEIIYALQADRYLVATTDFCIYPEAAQMTEKVGGLLDPNIEKMIALKPTHLFGVPAHQKLNDELQKFDLSVQMMPNEEIKDVLASIKEIGGQIGYEAQAERLAGNIQTRFDSLRNHISQKNKIQAILVIGRESGNLRNVMVAGSATFIDEVWQLAGGLNSYQDLPTRYATINLESMLRKNPDVIIEFDQKRPRGVYKSEQIAQWAVLDKVKAIQEGNLYIVGGSHSLIPGPRMIYLVEDFHKIIQLVTVNE